MFIFGFAFMFFSLYIVQAEIDGSSRNIIDEINVSEFVSMYNHDIAGSSDIIDKIFGNERINFYLDSELAFGVVTARGKIIEQNERGIEKPTLNVYMKSEDLKELIDGKLSIEDALTSGKIEYKGVGIVKRVKFWAINLVKSFFLGSGIAENKKKCFDTDGPINVESSFIKGKCTDKNGVSYEDTCISADPSFPNGKYRYVLDYDCNSDDLCEPKEWGCKLLSPPNECEYGVCVECPGSDSECNPSSPVSEKGLSVPDAPKPVSF